MILKFTEDCLTRAREGKVIKLRPVENRDLELILAWRNNPLCYAGYYVQKEPVDWETHYNWWHSNEKQSKAMAWIVQWNDEETRIRDIGYVRVHRCDTSCPEIDITIGEVSFWGKGAGKEAVSQAMEVIRQSGYKRTCARIVQGNERSERLFEGLGFKRSKLVKARLRLYERGL